MARDLRNKRYSQMGEKYRSRNTREEFQAKRKKQRKAGDSGAMETFDKKGGTKNSANGGVVTSDTPGATVFKGSTTNAPGVSVQQDKKIKGTGKGYAQRNPERDSANPQFKGNYDASAPKTREQLNNYDLQATGVGENQQRFSRQDAKGLFKAGYSKEDIIDYADSLGGGEGKNKKEEGFTGKAAQNMLSKWKFKLGGKQTEEEVAGLDQELVKQAQGGDYFGDEDRARYDELVKQKEQGQNTSGSTPPTNTTDINDSFNNDSQTEANVEADNSTTQTTGDFTGDVSGNNHTIDFSNTDNSFNITEGSTNFTYQSGSSGNVYNDTPMSAMSMMQALKADDGSGAASGAKYLAKWMGANNTLQAQLASNRKNHGQAAIKSNQNNRADPDPNNQIAESPLAMKDYAAQSFAKATGDPSQWQMPKMPSFNLSDIRKDNFDSLQGKDKDDDDD